MSKEIALEWTPRNPSATVFNNVFKGEVVKADLSIYPRLSSNFEVVIKPVEDNPAYYVTFNDYENREVSGMPPFSATVFVHTIQETSDNTKGHLPSRLSFETSGEVIHHEYFNIQLTSKTDLVPTAKNSRTTTSVSRIGTASTERIREPRQKIESTAGKAVIGVKKLIIAILLFFGAMLACVLMEVILSMFL